MNEMFYKCYYLYELVLSSSFTMEKVENYGNMFSNYYISVTQNGANLKDDVINEIDLTNTRDLKKNLILITINTAENKENLKFINYDGTENMIMLQNDEKIDFKNNISVNAGMTVIKLLFPEDSNKISCEGLFKNIPEITKIAFINFDICNNAKEMFSGCSNLEKLNLKLFATSEITDMNGMFSGCSNLKTLGVSSFDISKSEDVENMFCGCEKLTDIDKNSFGRTFFKCDDCDASKPFLIEYTSKCVENCGDSYYSIEEEKICVSNCAETEYNYAIEEEKKCVKDCDETEYIKQDNKCIKKEPEESKDKSKEEEKDNSKEESKDKSKEESKDKSKEEEKEESKDKSKEEEKEDSKDKSNEEEKEESKDKSKEEENSKIEDSSDNAKFIKFNLLLIFIYLIF
jgi:surface protein